MCSTINWGDVPTWIAAVGAILTVIVYYHLLRGEIRKREEEKELRSQYTQRRVAAWYDNNSVIVNNAGDEPVYNAVVYVGPMGINFDSQEDVGKFIETVLGTLGPGHQIQEPVSPRFTISGQFPDIPEVAIEFTDCDGKHWRRESRGQLHKVAYRRPFD